MSAATISTLKNQLPEWVHKADVNHLTIVTCNVDDFASFVDVRIENWFGL